MMSMKNTMTMAVCLLLGSGSAAEIALAMTHTEGRVDSIGPVHIPKSKQVLIAIPDTLAEFPYMSDERLQSKDRNAYWLMNRMIQMKNVAVTPDEDWAWMQAVGDCVAEYDGRIGRTAGRQEAERMAMRDIERLIDLYDSGYQSELNTWAYVTSVLAYYRTINTYDRLIRAVGPSPLKEAYRREYEAWHELNRALIGFMLEYTYRGASYSSMPMDTNGTAGRWSDKRHEELVVEEAILVYGTPFRSDSPAVSPEQIDTLLMPFGRIGPEGVIAEFGDNIESTDRMQQRIAERFDIRAIRSYAAEIGSGLRSWAAERARIAALLPESQRESYEELTRQMLHRLHDDVADLTKPAY